MATPVNLNNMDPQPPSETERTAEATDDHALLAAYVQGDERAFEALVDKYFRMIYSTAAGRTGDFHLAEEVAQTVFLILSRKARGFSSRANVCGWLMQTTRFVCRDAIKMRRRRYEKELDLEAGAESGLEAKAEPSLLEILLDEALLTLKTDEQAGVFARFVEGKTFKEIGEMLAISEDTAQKRISRSLDKLRTFMMKRGARVPVSTVTGLLVGRSGHEAMNQALQSAIHTMHAFLKDKAATGGARALADHTIRSLVWRAIGKFALTFALPAVVIICGVSAARRWIWPDVDRRIERLGRDWGAEDRFVARAMQTMATDGAAKVKQETDAIGREYSRIMAALPPLLKQPDERKHLEEFFFAELDEALTLTATQKTALASYLQGRLAQGATLQDSMKALALAAPAEAAEIKALLSQKQQQVFDQTYGANGSGLFAYAGIVATGKLDPSAPPAP